MIKYLRELTTVRKVSQDVFHLPSQDAQKHHRRHGTRLQFSHGLGQEKTQFRRIVRPRGRGAFANLSAAGAIPR